MLAGLHRWLPGVWLLIAAVVALSPAIALVPGQAHAQEPSAPRVPRPSSRSLVPGRENAPDTWKCRTTQSSRVATSRSSKTAPNPTAG